MDIIKPMSLEKRLAVFRTTVIEKNLVQTAHPSYAALYRRLVLMRRGFEFLVGSLVIFSSQQFIFSSAFFSPIWPTAGAALGAVFLRGNFLLLGIFFGTLVSYLVHHMPWGLSFIQSAIFVIYIYLMRKLALRLIGPVAPVASNSVLWKCYALIALLSAAHSFSIFAILTLSKAATFSFYLLYMGWLGELNGILCITLLCLNIEPFIYKRYFKASPAWWILALVICICHVFYLLVAPGATTILLAILFLLILCVYARFFGQFPTFLTLLGMAGIYLGSIRGFHLFDAASSQLQNCIVLTLFTLTAMLSISVATLVRQKQ